MPAEIDPVPSSRRRRFTPLVLAAGVAGALLVSFSLTGWLSAFTASILNSTNTTATGTLTMQEKSGATTCNSDDATPVTNNINTNAATCSTINKYGGSTTLKPGGSTATSITIGNTGTVTVSTFTLTPGACVQSANGTPNGSANDFCTQLKVVIVSGATSIYNGTALALGTGGAITLAASLIPAPAATIPITITVSLPAALGNTYQGLAASQPLTWGFTA